MSRKLHGGETPGFSNNAYPMAPVNSVSNPLNSTDMSMLVMTMGFAVRVHWWNPCWSIFQCPSLPFLMALIERSSFDHICNRALSMLRKIFKIAWTTERMAFSTAERTESTKAFARIMPHFHASLCAVQSVHTSG